MYPYLIAVLSLTFLSSFTLSAQSSGTMDARIRDAVNLVREKQNSGKPVPQQVINEAKGIAIIKITKGGLGISGQHGEGILITKTASGWSAPCAFDSSGGGIGFQIGVEVRKLIYILNNQDAVNAFAQDEKFKMNAIANATAGPDTVTEEASTINRHSIYVYALTDGAFAGAAVGGDVMGTNLSVNRITYGKSTSTADILNGKVARPASLKPLLEALKLN